MFQFGIKSVRPRSGRGVWVIRFDDEYLIFYDAKKGERCPIYNLKSFGYGRRGASRS